MVDVIEGPKVMQSAAGYYIGLSQDGEPLDRLSGYLPKSFADAKLNEFRSYLEKKPEGIAVRSATVPNLYWLVKLVDGEFQTESYN